MGRARFVWHEAIERFVSRTADLAVPMGRFTQELAVKQGVPSARCVIIPFPVPWADEARVTPLGQPPTAVFVGRLAAEKGVHVLLDAWSDVRARLPSVRLIIVGTGPCEGALRRQVATLKLGDSVDFRGWLSGATLRQTYEEAWVVTLPSVWEEGLGMVLVEAGLHGRAVVGSASGGIRDVVEHGRNGYLVEPGNAAALSDALIRVLSSEARAEHLGRNGPAIARGYLGLREFGIAETRNRILQFDREMSERGDPN